MKTTKITYLSAISVVAVFFLVLWSVWYSCYYYTLYWQEGFAFFSTLPDFTDIQVDLHADVFRYLGAYLLQFFRSPLFGAAIQAGFATFIVVCLGFCILKLLKEVRLMWIAFIPVPMFVAGQYADITLERSLLWCTCVLGAVVLCGLVNMKNVRLPIPKWLCSFVLMFGVPVIITGASVYRIMDKENEYQEITCKVDYHANRQEWQEVLKLIPPHVAQRDEFRLRYALLALSETGQLADHAFGYGVKDYSQFLFYGSEEPFERNFNALFYQALDMPNETVHQCYQQCLTSPFGFNFKSLRMLVDTYLEMGNYAIADKYMEVLRHTSFHQEWVESRQAKLESLKDIQKDDVKEPAPFVSNFLETITSLVNQYPTNKKYMDLCLCAILTTRNAEYFRQAFQVAGPVLYANGERIPRHYEEAILLIALLDKDMLKQYNISNESRTKFADFMNLYHSGQINLAKNKYPNSYWAFCF